MKVFTAKEYAKMIALQNKWATRQATKTEIFHCLELEDKYKACGSQVGEPLSRGA